MVNKKNVKFLFIKIGDWAYYVLHSIICHLTTFHLKWKSAFEMDFYQYLYYYYYYYYYYYCYYYSYYCYCYYYKTVLNFTKSGTTFNKKATVY